MDIKGDNWESFTNVIWSQPGRFTFHFLVDVNLCISNTQQKNLKSYLFSFYKVIKVKINAIMFLMPASSMRLEVISVL